MKVLTLILSALMLFTLCACGNEEPAKEDLVPIAPVTEQPHTPDINVYDENIIVSDVQAEKEPVSTEDTTADKSPTISEDEIITVPPADIPDIPAHGESTDTTTPKDDTDSEDVEIEPKYTEIEESEDEHITVPEDIVESVPEPDPEPEPVPEESAEVIDTAALEAYGRSYAASAYGYWGNPSTGFSSNAGYFPPTYVIINTMEDGYRYAREVVDAQYYDDIAAGQPITAEIDGVTVRRKINIYFQATEDPNMFLLYCFYGGE